MRKFIGVLIAVILMCLAGYLLLVLVYCLPTRNMEAHVQKSVHIFMKEGTYPWLTGIKTSQLDNFTDALMLLTASCPNEGNAWHAAVDTARYCVEKKNPVESLISIYGESGVETVTQNYRNYWHGYLVFLKPLLMFFDYSEIRYLIMLAQVCLFSLLVAGLAEQRKGLVIPTVFMWLFMNPIATMCSLQFNSVVVVTFGIMILIVHLNVLWKDDMYKWGMLFAVGGGG